MAPTPSNVSFTIRRPTPISRPSTGSPREGPDDDGETGIVFADGSGAGDEVHHTDSSDDDNFVVKQRLRQHKKKASVMEAPLVIPSKPNPDWREAAKRRRAACAHTSRAAPSFVPNSAAVVTGADGSVGGLGTRGTINTGPQLSGLQIKKRVELDAEEEGIVGTESEMTVSTKQSESEVVEETEDQIALRAILAGEDDSASAVHTIPIHPPSETDALKQDVQELPDVATADDYERVPISAFGAAMLRGMGWTDGAVASKSDKRGSGLTGLYLPQARPALLGIGAKEQELEPDRKGKRQSNRSDMRYVPVTRTEGGSSRSGTTSRRSSRSPSRKERSGYDDRERRRERDRDRDGDSGRTKDYDDKDRKKRDYREREGRGKQYDRRDELDRRDRRDRR